MIMRKFTLTLILMCTLGASISFAQYFEIGGQFGVTNYFGDLQVNHMEPSEYHLALGLFGRLNLNKHLSVKLGFMKGEISGTDLNSGTTSGRRQRNLSFSSPIYELSLTGEINLVPFDIRRDKIAAFYVFGGVAGFHFNPYVDLNGERYFLQKMGTEGQNIDPNRKPYSLYQFAIPMGIGTKININYRSNIGLEVGLRQTFTDYLDDVSGAYPDIEALGNADENAALLSYRSPEYYEVPLKSSSNPQGNIRGNSSKNDWYFFGGVTISINLTDESGLDYTNSNSYFMVDF